MTDATARFFEGLGGGGPEPLLRKATGSLRFDVADGSRTHRWLLTLDKGSVAVSRKNAAADCVVRADKTLLDAIVRGEVNGMAAYLRGELTVEGRPELLVLILRVLPAPISPASAGGRRRNL